MFASASSVPAVEKRETRSGATVITVRGKPGPRIAIMGGVHGDENEGVLAVRRVLYEVAQQELVGTVRGVTPANPGAWAAGSRTSVTDGKDLARCFPGVGDAGPTDSLAAELTAHVIADADLLIDLHSAGQNYEMPLFCGLARTGPTASVSRRGALAFGAPLIWAHDRISAGRSLSAAASLGVPAIYAECGGGGAIRASDLEAYVGGVLSVLAEWGMVRPPPAAGVRSAPRWVFGDGDLDRGAAATAGDFFVHGVEPGASVVAGDEIGVLYDVGGMLTDAVRAPRDGVVMFLRRQARIKEGDVLFVLADAQDPGA